MRTRIFQEVHAPDFAYLFGWILAWGGGFWILRAVPFPRTEAVEGRGCIDYFEAAFHISRFALTQSLAGKLHRVTTSSTTKSFPRATRSASSRTFAVRIW